MIVGDRSVIARRCSFSQKSAYMIVIFHIVEVRLLRQGKGVLISARYNLYCLKGFAAVD